MKIIENLDDRQKADKTFKLQDRISFRGLDIAIENKKGSIRRGANDNGTKWETFMHYPYGYIRKTESADDGEKIDCYVNEDGRDSEKVFVVNQNNPFTGKHDEQKIMLGFYSAGQAKQAYLQQYDNPKFFGSIQEMPFQEFKEKALNTQNTPKLIKAFGKLLKAFRAKDLLTMDLFAPPAEDVLEGKTVSKDGKLYEYRRSAKNPNVRRLYRKDDEAQGDLFGKPEITTLTGTKKTKVFDKQMDLFGSDKKEEKKPEEIKPQEEPNDKKSEGKPPKEIKKPDTEPPIEDESAGEEDKEPEFVDPKKKSKGKKLRREVNEQCIALLDSKTNEEMTEEDKGLLRQYSGRGNIMEKMDDISLNEFYTRKQESSFIWDCLKRFGFTGGVVIEPSVATGEAFISTAPENTLVTGVEIDPVSGRIADILHGQNHDIRVQSFEEYNAQSEGGFADAVIGNFPFGKRGLTVMFDPECKDISFHEQYFLKRSIDDIKNGGLIGVIVPTSIMDNQINPFRLEMNKQAEFLGAIRIPTGAFKHANAEVTTDMVFFKKRPQEIIDYLENLSSDQLAPLFDNLVLDAEFISGKYFANNPQYTLGKIRKGQFEGQFYWTGDVTKQELEEVASILKTEPTDYSTLGIDFAIKGKPELHVGDTKTLNGRLYRLNENHRWERVTDDDMKNMPLDQELQDKLGIKTVGELCQLKNDVSLKLALTRDQLELLDDPILTKELRLNKNKGDYRNEMLKRATLIGLEIAQFRKDVMDGKLSSTEAQMKSEKLQALLAEWKGAYGHPIHEAGLAKYFRGGGENSLVMVAGAFDSDGKVSQFFSDPNAYYKVYKPSGEVGKFDGNDIYSVVSYLKDNNIAGTIEAVRSLLEDKEVDVERLLLNNDDIFIDEKGDYLPLNEVCFGEVYGKIDSWADEIKKIDTKLAGEVEDDEKELLVARRRKYEAQIDEMKSRANSKELMNMPVSMSHAGKFFSIDHLNAYVQGQLGVGEYAGELVRDGGIITFKDLILRELYGLYLDKGLKENKDDMKRKNYLLKEFFPHETNNPMMLILLNEINNQAMPSVKKDSELRKVERVKQIAEGMSEYLQAQDDVDEITDSYNRVFCNYIGKQYDRSPIEGLTKFNYEKVIKYDEDGNPINARDKAGANTWATARRMYSQGKGLIAHGVGLGKAETLDSLVLTPDGYVRMGDVFVGQEIINSQGGISKITAIFPQGLLDAYEVEFNDGSKVVCNDEHLWSVRTEKEQARNKPFKIKTLKEIIPNILTNTKVKHLNYRIPMIKTVEFPEKEVVLPAYFMGLLLGNGGITNGATITLNNNDQDLVEYCKTIANLYGLTLYQKPSDEISYNFSSSDNINPIIKALRGLGLYGKKSEGKFIPEQYLINNSSTRLAVLQGLMDTDGYVAKDGMAIQYTSVSYQLKEDVKFLIHSFGGTVRESSRRGRYFNGEKYIDCQIAYTLTISLPADIVCFRGKRKLARFIPKTKYQPNRLIKSVKLIGKEEMQCIMVDAEDHLYATDNMIITHNTLDAIVLTLLAKETGRAKKPLIVTPKTVLLNWVAEIEKWTHDVNYIVIGQHKTGKFDKDGREVWKDDTEQERMLKMQRIQNEDFDMVLMSRDLYSTIDFAPDTKVKMVQELSANYLSGGGENKKAKKKLEAIESALAKLMINGKAMKGVYLDNLGFDMIVRDECFPAGTLIDGVPIEERKAGDIIRSFNHATNQIELKRVVNLQVREAKTLVRTKFDNNQSMVSTDNHPYFTQRGYVRAKDLTNLDSILLTEKTAGVFNGFTNKELSLLQKGIPDKQDAELENEDKRSNGILLWENMFGEMESDTSKYESYDSELNKFSNTERKINKENGREQSYAGLRNKNKGENENVADRTQTQESRRERQTIPCSAENFEGETGGRLGNGISDKNRDAHVPSEPSETCNQLQNRYSPQELEYRDRDRREFTQVAGEEITGFEKGKFFKISRVQDIEILQQTSDGTFGGLCKGGLVYNLEVEDNHNYFANNILVHNCHDVKNLLVSLEEDIAGINGTMAQRSLHNFFASKVIRSQNKEKGIFGLTATPISNSPLEVYNMLLPFAEKELQQMDISNMDEFIRAFARIETTPTSDPDGRIVEKKKFSGWRDSGILRDNFFRFVDYMTKDDLSPEESKKAGIKFPTEKPNNILSDLNEGQKELMNHCRKRMWCVRYTKAVYDKNTGEMVGIKFNDLKFDDDIAGGRVPAKWATAIPDYFQSEYLPRYNDLNDNRASNQTAIMDSYFAIQSDMIKIAGDLSWYREAQEPQEERRIGKDEVERVRVIPDQRFGMKISPEFVEQYGKIAKMQQLYENVGSIYKSGGKQLVFAINKSIHNKLRDEIIASGVKPEEIAIVNADTMKSSADRVKISDDFNSGKIKVIVGNYATMGEGLNFNKLCSDIHHLQPAWNYLQIEQGNGRGIRQGNDLDFVNTHYYMSKGSIDTFMRDKIASKGKMVDQFLRGEAEWDDEAQVGENQLMMALAENPEEAKAIYEAGETKLKELTKGKDKARAYQNFDEFYELQAKMKKTEDKGSKRYKGLESQYNSMQNRLINNPEFTHHDYLDLDQKPIVIPKFDAVIPVGSVIQFGYSDNELAIVKDFTPSTGRVELQIFNNSYGTPDTRTMHIKEFAPQFNSTVKKSSVTVPEVYERAIKNKGVSFIYQLPKDVFESLRGKVMDQMKEDNNEVLFKNMDGKHTAYNFREAMVQLTIEGGRIIMPQDNPEYPKLIKQSMQEVDEVIHKGLLGDYTKRRKLIQQKSQLETLARSVYGREFEKGIDKAIRKLRGEDVTFTFKVPKAGAPFLKKLNDLVEDGYLNQYDQKVILTHARSGSKAPHPDYSLALRREFLIKKGVKDQIAYTSSGEAYLKPDNRLTPQELDEARAIDAFTGDEDNYVTLENIFTPETTKEVA